MDTKTAPGPATPHPKDNKRAVDAPGVLIFPPFLFVGAFLLGLAPQLLWPVHLLGPWPARVIGVVLVLVSGSIAIPAVRTMKRAGTNVDPAQPSTTIVRTGPFRFTRNPIYLANTILFLALSFLFNSVWPLSLLIPMLLVLYWGVIRREERYLEAKFGAAYLSYKAQVRRWI